MKGLLVILLSFVCFPLHAVSSQQGEAVVGQLRLIEKATSLAHSTSSSQSSSSGSSGANALTDALESMKNWRTLSEPASYKEKRVVLMVLAGLVVLLYWIVLTQFALPASKTANIELRTADLHERLPDMDRIMQQGLANKKRASTLN